MLTFQIDPQSTYMRMPHAPFKVGINKGTGLTFLQKPQRKSGGLQDVLWWCIHVLVQFWLIFLAFWPVENCGPDSIWLSRLSHNKHCSLLSWTTMSWRLSCNLMEKSSWSSLLETAGVSSPVTRMSPLGSGFPASVMSLADNKLRALSQSHLTLLLLNLRRYRHWYVLF